MSTIRSRHLDEEAILKGVVDARDLTEPEREHLSSCRVCRDKLQGLIQALDRLSEKVEENLPPVTSSPRLPAGASKRKRRFMMAPADYRLWAAAVATALLAVVFLWMGTPNRRHSESIRLWRQTEAEMLFTAPESVQEELLPPKLAWLLETEPFILDNEFIDFVAPFEASNGAQAENGGVS